MKIVLHIDRMVVDGLASAPAGADVQEALQAELGRLLRAEPARPVSSSRRDAPAPPLGGPAPATASGIGQAVAHAVHGALRTPP